MQIMSQCYSFLQGYSSEYFLYIYVTNDHVQHKKKNNKFNPKVYWILSPGEAEHCCIFKDHFTRFYCYSFITEKQNNNSKTKTSPLNQQSKAHHPIPLTKLTYNWKYFKQYFYWLLNILLYRWITFMEPFLYGCTLRWLVIFHFFNPV